MTIPKRISNCFVYVLALLLAVPGAASPPSASPASPDQESAPASPLPARSDASQSAGAVQRTRSLRIIVLEGDNAINSIPAQSAAVPIVEVRDQNDMPVEGAAVVFQLPAVGPGGSFPDGLPSLKTFTNARGQAVARGFRINSQPGRFSLRVTASFANLSASHILTQTNSLKQREAMEPRRSRKWLWIGIAGAATAAAIGTAVALRPASVPRVSASAGPVIIAAP